MAHDTTIQAQAPGVAAARIGVLDFIRAYRRQLPIFLAVAGAIFLAVAAYTWLQTPRYTATATVQVAPRRAEIGTDRSAPVSDPTADASVDTQVEILKSPSLAQTVVDKMGLADEPLFSRLTHAPGKLARLGLGSGEARSSLTPQQRRGAAADAVMQSLDVRRVAQTFVLEIAATNHDRALAAQIANTLADAYIQQSTQIKLNASGKAGQLLSAQLSKAQADVNAAEDELGRYKVANNLMSVDGSSTVAEQELGNLDQQVATAQAEQAEAQARYDTARQQVQRGSTGEDVGDALGSPVVQELRKQRSEVARRIAEYSNRYGPLYPALASSKQELEAIDNQISGEVHRILTNLQAQSQVAARRAGSLEANRQRSRSAVAGNNVASVRLGALQLRANAARQIYEELLSRVREIGTQTATTQPDARLDAAAAVPTAPSSPNVPINLLVGLLLGIAGGIGAVVLRQALEQGLSTMEDVETRLNLPYLATLPTLASSAPNGGNEDPIAAVVNHNLSAFTEGFRSLSAAVLWGGNREQTRSILITSAIPDEGKTTTAACLARVLALSGHRVVLVDADLRRPALANAMQLQVTHGLQDVLEDKLRLVDATLADTATDLRILPLVPSRKVVGAPMEDGRFARLLDQLKSEYDLVVLDGSPILPVTDGRLLAAMVDAVVMLARWRKTPEPAVNMAVSLLASAGAKIRGVALSRVDILKLARSGYGDPAKYYHLYKKYYTS